MNPSTIGTPETDLCVCCTWDVTRPDRVIRLAADPTHPGPVVGDTVRHDQHDGLVVGIDGGHLLVSVDNGTPYEIDAANVEVLTAPLRARARLAASR
ncbi:hypothetical protein SUDANB95_07995 (plasmid) [Actinosynnema sp. ALI-1.44]